jgi:hypothetical protein
MQTGEHGSMIVRTFLATLIFSASAACDRANPLAPDASRPGVASEPVVAARRSVMPHGTPLTREEARRREIEAARIAVALARSGATTGLSDGRQITGGESVLLWERRLRALETRSSLLSASEQLASADGGYVYGSTVAGFAGYDAARATSVTYGSSAFSTFVSGELTVFLYSTVGGHARTAFTPYMGIGGGDEAWASGLVNWDYNWQAQSGGFARATHSADYGEYQAATSSFAGF